MDYDSAVEHALEIGEDPEDYLRRIEKRTPRASSQMERLCGLEETDPLQRLLERTWNAIQKSGVAILLLLVLCGVSRADSLSIVTQDLTQGSVLPLLDDVAEDMAENLLAAQLAAPYTQWESDSLQLSINSVLKAIGLEQSWGATYCDDSNCSIAWLQSTVAIDDGAQLSLSPTSIDFGDVPVSTPESSMLLLLLPVFGLMYYRTPSKREVDRAADVLEIGEPDRSNMHNFYRRERMQNREANIKLLKALGIFALKVIGISLAAWALFQTWEERIPH